MRRFALLTIFTFCSLGVYSQNTSESTDDFWKVIEMIFGSLPDVTSPTDEEILDNLISLLEDDESQKERGIIQYKIGTYDGEYYIQDDIKLPWGFGTFKFNSGMQYLGDFVNGLPHGTGTMTLNDETKYSGQFIEGKISGWGTFTVNGQSKTGLFLNAKFIREEFIPHPKAKYFSDRISDYTKSISFAYDDGVYYGEYIIDDGRKVPHGGGQYSDEFITYQGEFNYGEFTGKARVITDYFTYVGDVIDKIYNGHGIIYDWHGAVYEGQFKDGEFDGHGVLKNGDGSQYEGDFKEGVMHGHGKYTTKTGDVYEGLFENGSFVK